ncbi:MAG: aldo/keto reductase [Telmatospirillum sp.]|nr:aldo/keto reductase [Telmatospirillum sp.]
MIAARTLGKSGIAVTELGFGGAPLGDLFAVLDEATSVATVEAALDAGVTLLDTSPLYGHGLSEHRIGAALRRRPQVRPVLCTKVGRVADPFLLRGTETDFVGGLPHRLRFDYSYDGAMRSIEQSLLRMGVSRLDIVLIHDVDIWTHGAAAIDARFEEAVAGAYRALRRLRDEKTIGALGVGVNEADMCLRFAERCDIDCVLLAGRYSLLEQPAAEAFLPLAQKRDIGVMLGGVFNSGILATGAVAGAKYNYKPAPPEIRAKVEKIEAVCRRHGVKLADAALRFALAHPTVASVVLGAVAPVEIAAQQASLAAAIPGALWTDLASQGLLDASLPVPQ